MIRLLFSLFLVALAGFVFFQFSQPVLDEIDRLRSEKKLLEEGLENAKELRKVMNKLLTTFNNFPPEDLTRLNKFLPDSVDSIRLVIDINTIAARSGMAIKNLRLTAEEEGESPPTGAAVEEPTAKAAVRLGFAVTGPYLNLKSFLTDLARSLRLVEIASLNFASGEPGEPAARERAEAQGYTYNFEVKTYWLK